MYLNSRKQIFAERSILGVYTNIRAILNSRRWLLKIINSRTSIRLKNKQNYSYTIRQNVFRKQPSFILHFTVIIVGHHSYFQHLVSNSSYCTEQRHSICLADRLWQTKECPLTCMIFHSFKQHWMHNLFTDFIKMLTE
jgi:hypothetical protein